MSGNGAGFRTMVLAMLLAAFLGLAVTSVKFGNQVNREEHQKEAGGVESFTQRLAKKGVKIEDPARAIFKQKKQEQQQQPHETPDGDESNKKKKEESEKAVEVQNPPKDLIINQAPRGDEQQQQQQQQQQRPNVDVGGGVQTWNIPWEVSKNPEACGVQPNETTIDPYKGCPLPGLNNLLYTQTNRWYCVFRDSVSKLELRDRTCDKGSVTPFRFSSIIAIDYHGAASAKSGAGSVALTKTPRICWSDIKRQNEAKNCAWKDIPSFYGKPDWWKARKFFDFQAKYYLAARKYIEHHFNNEPFISVHLRRGDYFTHCVSVRKKHTPAWLPFTAHGAAKMIKSLADLDPKRAMQPKIDHHGNPMPGVHSNCYPSFSEIQDHFARLREQTGFKHIFLATNLPEEFANLTESHGIHFFQPDPSKIMAPGAKTTRSSAGARNNKPPLKFTASRKMDLMILEMCVASQGDHFVFNKYSSFSGSIYEMARIRGKVKEEDRLRNVMVW